MHRIGSRRGGGCPQFEGQSTAQHCKRAFSQSPQCWRVCVGLSMRQKAWQQSGSGAAAVPNERRHKARCRQSSRHTAELRHGCCCTASLWAALNLESATHRRIASTQQTTLNANHARAQVRSRALPVLAPNAAPELAQQLSWGAHTKCIVCLHRTVQGSQRWHICRHMCSATSTAHLTASAWSICCACPPSPLSCAPSPRAPSPPSPAAPPAAAPFAPRAPSPSAPCRPWPCCPLCSSC